MYFVIFIFIINQNSNFGHCLTCNDVLEMPDDRILSVHELKTMLPKDIVQCLVHLGRNKLDTAEAEHIWNVIVEFHEGVSNVPDEVLMSLNWVTVAIKPEDYSNITLCDIDVITNFGRDYNLSSAQLSTIANRVREDFGSKDPEDYTVYDLTALRQILCAFNRSEIERIHPSAYREAASVIGKIKNCPQEVLQGFASLAIQKDGFGSPNLWSNATLDTLGNVVEHFPKDLISKIKYKKKM